MTTDIEAKTTGGRHAATPTSRKTAWSRAEDALLTILAALGVVCIAATIAAFALSISLIMFKTGSMSPTIPTGSLAVVKQIPATAIQVGDVVTVSRGEGQLPVTHRVLTAVPVGDGRVTIEMQGDANDSPDPHPYVVAEARKVLWHVPGLAYVVARVSQPIYMAGITLAASLLVVWAFWPRRQD